MKRPILSYRIILLLVCFAVSPAHGNALPLGEQNNDRILWETTSGSWIAARPITRTAPQTSASPSLGINYIISLVGTFPSPNRAFPTIGQIEMFAGNFAPLGYAFCDGQLLSISSNIGLFSILGTIYGGDGRSTFALPDLRGRLALHSGTGPGLINIREGSRLGSLQHTHSIR